jgi:NADPH:quinone reductase-like Zn-dependent oxidoreductase
MKAVVFRDYGREDRLVIEDVASPKIGDDELLVKTLAAAVNPLDWKIMQGQIRFVTGFIRPRITRLGHDVCGEVIETGRKVSTFQKGDRIYAMLGRRAGAFAEYAAVPEENAVLAPSTLSDSEAAAVPLASLTALQALRDKAKIKVGQKVLINGASGGVGTFAVQIAGVLGATVTAVCSGRNTEFVLSLGADSVIDYIRSDFTEGKDVYDIIFDAVANRSFSSCRHVLSTEGIYVTTVPQPKDVLYMALKMVAGGQQAFLVMVKPISSDLKWMSMMIDEGKIRPVIDREYQLSQIAEAFAYSQQGRARGKIVITIS